MTNETYLAMTSDKIWWAKKNSGKNPTPPLIGMVAQMYACATHDIDAQKMATIKARNVPTLVVGALHDKMIKYERSQELAKELNPVDFVTLNSGHTVIECHLELNQAVERLFPLAGGRGLAFDSPFQRGLRDVLAATSQNSMAWDVAAITYGHLRFGAVLTDPRLFPGR